VTWGKDAAILRHRLSLLDLHGGSWMRGTSGPVQTYLAVLRDGFLSFFKNFIIICLFIYFILFYFILFYFILFERESLTCQTPGVHSFPPCESRQDLNSGHQA
jgi:hypothetical protein